MKTSSKELGGGFTLIELLVVIAIIGILVSILLPSLTKAKDLAKNATCLNNCRRLAMASQLYAGSNDDYWPARAWVDASTGVLLTTQNWQPTREYYRNQNGRIYDLFNPFIKAFVGEEAYMDCPVDPTWQTGRGSMYATWVEEIAKNGWLQGEYSMFVGYQSWDNPQSGITWDKTSYGNYPSPRPTARTEKTDSCEAIWGDTVGIASGGNWYYGHADSTEQAGCPSGMNASFADGSSRWVAWHPSTSSSRSELQIFFKLSGSKGSYYWPIPYMQK